MTIQSTPADELIGSRRRLRTEVVPGEAAYLIFEWGVTRPDRHAHRVNGRREGSFTRPARGPSAVSAVLAVALVTTCGCQRWQGCRWTMSRRGNVHPILTRHSVLIGHRSSSCSLALSWRAEGEKIEMPNLRSNRDRAHDRQVAKPQINHSQKWALQLVPDMAKTIMVVVFTGLCMIALLNILYTPRSLVDYATSVVYIAVTLVLQLFYISRTSPQPRPPLSYLALLAQAALVYLPLLQFQESWIVPPGFLCGSVLLLLPPVLAWSASALIVASTAAAQTAFTGSPIDIAYTTVATTITALVVYGLTRLATLLTELHKARIETARMAVAEERMRFARDLHDQLGYSLSAITLKSELIHRLLLKQPAEAENLVLEVLDISRRAVADVRAVASGYQELSLDAETQSASSVLTAADVVIQMNLDYGQLPTRVSATLAILLREGVTNVLRHSKAENCEITIRQEAGHVNMAIVNDGAVRGPAGQPTAGGSGIDNLSARIALLGGTFSAGLDEDGRFRLHATAPIVPEQTSSDRSCLPDSIR